MGTKVRKPLHALTKLEKERQLKKDVGQEIEKLEATGQESTRKAQKWVTEDVQEFQKDQKTKENDGLNKLDMAKGKIITYKSRLMELMHEEMEHYSDELPPGYTWYAKPTNIGIELWFRNNYNDWFARGLKISEQPEYDLQGIARLIIQAVDTMQKQIEPIKKESSIILP